MTRLFTFGCSYTRYYYPTWADYLGAVFDKHFQFGTTGAGNKHIFNSFIYALQKYKINSNDSVVISWTSLDREDRIFNKTNDFIRPGCIFSQDVFPDSWVDKYFNLNDKAIEFIGYIHSILAFSKSIGFNLHMLSMGDYRLDGLLGSPHFIPLYRIKHQNDFYKKSGLYSAICKIQEQHLLPDIDSFTSEIDKEPTRWEQGGDNLFIEQHPTSETHLLYAKSIFENKYDFKLFDDNLYFKFLNLAREWDDYCRDLELVKKGKQLIKIKFPHILTKTERLVGQNLTDYTFYKS